MYSSPNLWLCTVTTAQFAVLQTITTVSLLTNKQTYSLPRILLLVWFCLHLSASGRLSYLHWLPVHYWIQFKIATLTYKTLATFQPSYLYNLLQLHQPSRALHSSTQQLLQVPYMSTDFGRRTFRHSSPVTWNSIPTSTKNCCQLKSHLIAQLINN